MTSYNITREIYILIHSHSLIIIQIINKYKY